jgi:protein-disulfide isomerase
MRITATKLGLATLAAVLCLAAGVGGHRIGRSSAWAASASPAPSKPVTIQGDPARDTALRTYLQKRFRLANIDQVKLGPLIQSPLAGLFGRQISLTNDKGDSRNGLLFTDRNETKFVLGEYLDLDRDPWGRVSMTAVHLDDRPVLGPSTAPVTLVEFADFECPFCAHAFGIVETLANSTYKGQVRVVFKAFPLNGHQWAMKAAEAAECARLQNPDAFWEFARDFYTNQGSINPGNLQKHIDGVADRLKLDAPSLKACMAAPAAADRVKQDVADGEGLHVTSTPTFFINGIPVIGLPDEKTLDFVVSSELAGTSHASR